MPSTPTIAEQLAYEELRPGQLFQIGRELYQVSDVYDRYLTAQALYPKPARTVVRSILKDDYDQGGHQPTKSLIARYESAWGFQKGSTK